MSRTSDTQVLQLYDAQATAYGAYLRAKRGAGSDDDHATARARTDWVEAYELLREAGGTPLRVRGLLQARTTPKPSRRGLRRG